jgi:hypothetical protein
MQFEGALIKELGVSFAIVVVKSTVLNNSTEISNAGTALQHYFPRVPIILMAQNSRCVPTYQGRADIVQLLSQVHPSRIACKHYSY